MEGMSTEIVKAADITAIETSADLGAVDRERAYLAPAAAAALGLLADAVKRGTADRESVVRALKDYLTDAIGSVIGLVDVDGNKVDTYTYSPRGVRLLAQSSEPIAQPYRFAGNYQDPTGLYHLQNRYYDAKIGRFTQPDPAGQEQNPYLYAEGDPARHRSRPDPAPGPPHGRDAARSPKAGMQVQHALGVLRMLMRSRSGAGARKWR